MLTLRFGLFFIVAAILNEIDLAQASDSISG